MNLLDRILYEPPGGQFREFFGIITHFAPRDLTLYRRLLPLVFDMPAYPLVTIYMIDFVRVSSWPLTPYQEWSLLLLSGYNGQEAWHPLTMPVSGWLPMSGGRRLGFPKYIADKIALSEEDDAIVGEGTHGGALEMSLTFTAGHSRPLAAWETELADDPGFLPGAIYCLVPPGEGPRLLRIDLVPVAPPNWDARRGMVAVRCDPSAPWAGLLPEDGPVPGKYNHFVGGMNMKAERLV